MSTLGRARRRTGGGPALPHREPRWRHPGVGVLPCVRRCSRPGPTRTTAPRPRASAGTIMPVATADRPDPPLDLAGRGCRQGPVRWRHWRSAPGSPPLKVPIFPRPTGLPFPPAAVAVPAPRPPLIVFLVLKPPLFAVSEISVGSGGVSAETNFGWAPLPLCPTVAVQSPPHRVLLTHRIPRRSLPQVRNTSSIPSADTRRSK